MARRELWLLRPVRIGEYSATTRRMALLGGVLLAGCGGDKPPPPHWKTFNPPAFLAPPTKPGTRTALYVVESRLRTDVTGLAVEAGRRRATGFRSDATCRWTSRRAFRCRARSFYRTERDGRTCLNLIQADYVGTMRGDGRIRYRRLPLRPAPTPECYAAGSDDEGAGSPAATVGD